MQKTFLLLVILLVTANPALAEKMVIDYAFSPRQGATELIVKTIEGAQKSIHVAIYTFTSRKIGDALVAAKKRGVDVRVVVDRDQNRVFGISKSLSQRGIPIHRNGRYNIMHDKFMIIDSKTLQTGSFNYTSAAEKSNAENILVIHNAPRDLIASYNQHWQNLWDESR